LPHYIEKGGRELHIPPTPGGLTVDPEAFNAVQQLMQENGAGWMVMSDFNKVWASTSHHEVSGLSTDWDAGFCG
jgi:hypothetical protein